MSDGGALCFGCAKKEVFTIGRACRDQDRRSGWMVEAVDTNYEDEELFCDHCGEQIESAYGEEK